MLRISLACIALSMAYQASSFADEMDKQAKIDEALSAAPPTISDTVKVMDWQGNVLREGEDEYTCFPTPPSMREMGKAPMCLDEVWMAWGDAWMNKKPFDAERGGVTYMLGGDAGASNADPYATAPSEDNQWIVEGPHLMIITPDHSALEGLSTDPESGGTYVTWKGTPYAHIMVPVGERPQQDWRHSLASVLKCAGLVRLVG
jgi:hypothetical protein